MMSDYLISIYLIPETIIEGSEYERLLAMYPGVSHDGVNRIFTAVLPDAVDPVIFTVTEGEDPMLTLGRLMFADGRAIHGMQSELAVLHQSTMWQLWCCQHETKEELAAQYLEVFDSNLDLAPPLEELKAQVRVEIKTLIVGT